MIDNRNTGKQVSKLREKAKCSGMFKKWKYKTLIIQSVRILFWPGQARELPKLNILVGKRFENDNNGNRLLYQAPPQFPRPRTARSENIHVVESLGLAFTLLLLLLDCLIFAIVITVVISDYFLSRVF